jgi:RNA polymerase sigma-B factor
MFRLAIERVDAPCWFRTEPRNRWRIGCGALVSEPNTDYAELTEMFRALKLLEQGSPAFRRQRDAIMRRCLALADHIARRYGGRGESHEDLVQVARVGLVNAVNRYDVDNGAEFLSFAVPTMIGEVRRHFRDYGWALKVPRRIKELQPQLNKAHAELSQRLGRAPNASEIAQHLGIDRELIVEATIAGGNYSTMSTDRPYTTGDDDTVLSETLGHIDTNLDKVLDVETVRPLIAALSDRERTVIRLRFFDNMTQTQIAGRIGCSQMHVSRLLTKAVDSLRTRVRDPEFAEAG